MIEAGLKVLQGKGIVNSISMKEGEEAFIAACKESPALWRGRGGDGIRRAGPGRHGGAQSRDLQTAPMISSSNKVGFPPEDIIFDPNIFAVATGIEEHNDYARGFIEAARRIRAELPYVHVSGGLSNISFSFRGNDTVREAMHSAFLYHAIKAGMDMGIVNAGQLAVYEDIPDELRERRRGRAAQSPPRRDGAAAGARAALQERFRRAGRKSRSPGAELPSKSASNTRWCMASPISSTEDVEEARLVADAAARRDRRPADGRHERGRRSVRRGEDVPAAGRQIRARDEEGGRAI